MDTVETAYAQLITAEDVTSTDIGVKHNLVNQPSTEGNPNVPIDEDTPATLRRWLTTKTVDGEGTTLLFPDGTRNLRTGKILIPLEFTGVTVKRGDKNIEITAKYALFDDGLRRL